MFLCSGLLEFFYNVNAELIFAFDTDITNNRDLKNKVYRPDEFVITVSDYVIRK